MINEYAHISIVQEGDIYFNSGGIIYVSNRKRISCN